MDDLTYWLMWDRAVATESGVLVPLPERIVTQRDVDLWVDALHAGIVTVDEMRNYLPINVRLEDVTLAHQFPMPLNMVKRAETWTTT